ncbi:MAG: hypothetical protein ACOCVV_11535, partial [Marinobacter sp.]
CFLQRGCRVPALFLLLAVLAAAAGVEAADTRPDAVAAPALVMSGQQLEWVGQQIFRNECASREACLVHWNPGEAFPSLGIGHFIWYPTGINGPFRESFPALVVYLQQQGAPLPEWLMSQALLGAPWPDRSAFLAAQGNDPRIDELRALLADEKGLQVAFILARAEAALSDVVAAARNRSETRRKIALLSASPGGLYALIDYVNFKGEGLLASERYQGVGWGLLQVLESMTDPAGQKDALPAFRRAAAEVLTARAERAKQPIEREQWLPGWLKRVDTYREPDRSF